MVIVVDKGGAECVKMYVEHGGIGDINRCDGDYGGVGYNPGDIEHICNR